MSFVMYPKSTYSELKQVRCNQQLKQPWYSFTADTSLLLQGYQSEAKRSEAKQSKAKQSKAKQSKAKQSKISFPQVLLHIYHTRNIVQIYELQILTFMTVTKLLCY